MPQQLTRSQITDLADQARVAAALGTELTALELAAIQSRHETGPMTDFGEWLDIFDNHLAGAAFHDNLSPDIHRYLLRHDDPLVVLAAGANAASTPEQFRAALDEHREVLATWRSPHEPTLDAIEHRGNERDLRAIAKATRDEQRLQRLTHHESSDVRLAVCENGSTVDTVLRRLVTDENDLVARAAARHVNATGETLAVAAQHHHQRVRVTAAQAHKTPLETLRHLAEAPEPSVRHAVARHNDADGALHHRLAGDDDEGVRSAVAGSASDPELLHLLLDRVPDHAIAANRHAPAELLETIARRNPTVGGDLGLDADTGSGNLATLRSLASNPATPEGVVDRLIELAMLDEVERLWIPLSLSPALDTRHRDVLARHPLESARATVARRGGPKQLSEAAYLALAADPAVEVRRAVANNSWAPASIRSGLESEFPDETKKARLQKEQRDYNAYKRERSKLQAWRDMRRAKRSLKRLRRAHPEVFARIDRDMKAMSTWRINGGS
ncbi:MAG: hypothetical protein AAF567_14970 [Actinomycetota bacterium]